MQVVQVIRRPLAWLPSVASAAAFVSIACGSALMAAPALAQAESFLVGPGSSVGPSTKVKPTNCVTAPDGSITCDTKLENSPSDTQAKPIYEQFKN